MEVLSKLTPAETYLILKGVNGTLKDLMKYTFMDLLLTQSLKIEEVRRQTQKRDRVRVYRYVTIGDNYGKFKPLPHEKVYLSPFIKNNSIKVLLKNLIKMGIQNAGGEWKFKRNQLLASPNLSGLYKRDLLFKLMGICRLNSKGLKVRDEIQSALEKLEKELPEILHTDQKKALEILLKIRGNIFLLENLDFELLKKIDKDLKKELYSGVNDDYFDYYIYFDSFIDVDDTFDNSFHSYDFSDSDSGCGSGCSGCGGCGGCS